MKRVISSGALFILFIGFVFALKTNAQNIDIPGPVGSDKFGTEIFALPNGNIVITDPEYDIPNGAANVGAVYLYNSAGVLISSVRGSSANDRVGGKESDFASVGGIQLLTNGNFVIFTPAWDNGSQTDAGAVTFVNGASGLSGVVSQSNSLVGSAQDDAVGSVVTPLNNGNYVASSPRWDNGTIIDAGAVTFGNGNTGVSGIVSAANSLVGSSETDIIGSNITALTNGNYVVDSPLWDSATVANAGASTFANGTSGISGTISAANSLIGVTPGDLVGEHSVALTNGNYIVLSPSWDNVTIENAGAATFVNGTTGITGNISSGNSLVGSSTNDEIGSGLPYALALSNGNYVVISPSWNNGAIQDVGAVTFGNGTSGITGNVTVTNSLIGSTANDRIGSGAPGSLIIPMALTNGNYVIGSQYWDRGAVADAGAATFGNGTTGTTGVVSASNSLAGSSTGDFNFAALVPLTNGNYVVGTQSWKNGSIGNAGASTFGSGTTGVSGSITAATSLVGSTSNDLVGRTTIALVNGNYVVPSPSWDNGAVVNTGAATFANGTTGITGPISSANSLVGSTANDSVGFGVTPLMNGNYVVGSFWNNGMFQKVGAVTFGNGATGISGTISPSNSLVGSSADDAVGIKTNKGVGSFSTYKVKALSNGDYIVPSSSFDNGSNVDAGAVTYGSGNGNTVGTLSTSNSFLGTVTNGKVGDSNDFNYAINRIVIGRPVENIVTIYNPNPTTVNTPARFDFDGDGRSDASVFRQSNRVWYLNQSTAGFTAVQFGLDSDQLAPADYDGDGKTDVAIWRESERNFYIYNSSNSSIRIENFGLAGDKLTVADWDNDGKADLSVYREGAQSVFYFRGSNNNPNGNISFLPWGTTGDKPVNGDFDGDGIQDAAVFRPSNSVWYIYQSSNAQVRYVKFGLPTDKLIPADYDGDGKTDVAVFRNGVWYILQSTTGQIRYEYFGLSNDTLVPADYDGDGKTDVALFRNGVWYIDQSTNGFSSMSFGISNDKAIPNAYVNP